MVGLVMTTFNRIDMTKASLESLVNNTRSDYMVFVVDNRSSDGTVEYLKEHCYRVCALDRRVSLAQALNIGMRWFLADESLEYFGWIHNDMEFTEGWLESLIAAMRLDGNLGRASSLLIESKPVSSGRKRSGSNGFTNPGKNSRNPGENGSIKTAEEEIDAEGIISCWHIATGSPWIMRRTAVRDTGEFDESYRGYSEHVNWDYTNRLLKAGYGAAIISESIVYHRQCCSGAGNHDRRSRDEDYRFNEEYYFRKWGQVIPMI